MLQPRSIGGMELKPPEFAHITEALAAADGSTARVVCQGNDCAMSAAYLDSKVPQQMVGPVAGILARGPQDATASPEPGASPAAARTRSGWVPI
jgi:alkylation response protein AidB-like acyl-CoA dehydrogenase